MSVPFAAGALCSTVGDLVRWTRVLSGGRVVRRATYTLMTTPTTLSTGSQVPYGFGLIIDSLDGSRQIAHGGGINGFRSYLSYYPDEDLTIVVLTNSGVESPKTLAETIARTVLRTNIH